MRDDLRPRGTVEVTCTVCGWNFWIEALSPLLPDGPFTCSDCAGNDSRKKVEIEGGTDE